MSQWVALIPATVVGIAAVAVTVFIGLRQQRTLLAAARLQVEGQTAIAREERAQRRAETSYEELAASAAQAVRWSSQVLQSAVFGGPRASPDEPDALPEPEHVPVPSIYYDPPSANTALALYWSHGVREIVGDLRVQMFNMRQGAVYFRTERKDPGSIPAARGPDAVQELFSRDSLIRETVDRLRNLITDELTTRQFELRPPSFAESQGERR